MFLSCYIGGSVIEKGEKKTFFELWNEEYRDGINKTGMTLHYKPVKSCETEQTTMPTGKVTQALYCHLVELVGN